MEEFDSNHSVVSPDPNNNTSSSLKTYSLRPRAARKCEEEEESPVEPEVWKPSRIKRKQKSMPLSKYRRKTANARERSRMKEINDAFEALRRAIPQMSARDCSSEKLTKITTLRLAMKYIATLNNTLHDQDLGSDGESLLSDTPTAADLFSSASAPRLSDHTLAADLFPSLLAPLPSVDTCLELGVPEFGNSSYVFEDTLFLTDFS